MRERDLKRGDVIQIDPRHDPLFGGCLAVVDEPKRWGAAVYVTVPRDGQSRQAYYRVGWENMEYVGHAAWTVTFS